MRVFGWATMLLGAFNVGMGVALVITGHMTGLLNVLVGVAAWYMGNLLIQTANADRHRNRRL